MEDYEYKVSLRGEGIPPSNKKELIVEQVTNGLIRIVLRDDDTDSAILSFLPNGTIRIYRNSAERLGFKAEIF